MALRQLEHVLSRVAVVCRSGGGRHGGAAAFSCRPPVRSSGFHSSTAACTVEGPSHVADIKTIEVEGLQAPTQVVEFVPLGGDDSDPTQHTASVLLMHGLGDTAMGWTDAVSGFFAPAMPHVKFILPTAPTQPVTLNMGMPMPSWYDLKGLSERQNEDCDGIEASRNVVNALLEQESKAGIPMSRIVLSGFSQGGALALYCAMHQSTAPAGVLAMSAYLPMPAKMQQLADAGVLAQTPFLFCHGGRDPMVLPDWGKAATEHVRAFGATDVKFNMYPSMVHSACEEELHDVTEWLTQRLPSHVS